ncbi:hypothetical protein AcV7_010242 [Taiwanofungus camphoratus]|nr:hypothetical protein AcV7_010242 [Antrodia cinnamomea]
MPSNSGYSIPSQSVITSEVPVVSGDILRSTDTPAVSPPGSTSSRRGSSSIADAVGIDLNAIGRAEARKIMSEEHRILGFRPPHGSLAAEAQAAAAKHPEGNPSKVPDPIKLKELAREDAARILAERRTNTEHNGARAVDSNSNAKAATKPPPTGGVNLSTISVAEARALMSHEHKALGFRPPPGSLAAEAQAAAAKHPEGNGTSADEEALKEVALKDAERIKADRELNMVGEVNVSTLGEVGAARLTAATERVLGHTPPPGSLAAEGVKAAALHPEGGSFPVMDGDPERLEAAGTAEGERLKTEE